MLIYCAWELKLLLHLDNLACTEKARTQTDSKVSAEYGTGSDGWIFLILLDDTIDAGCIMAANSEEN